jgi:hypothetical protein
MKCFELEANVNPSELELYDQTVRRYILISLLHSAHAEVC